MEYTEGQAIWIAMPWIDDDMAVRGEFIAETAKRCKVLCHDRGVMYVAKKNVSAATA